MGYSKSKEIAPMGANSFLVKEIYAFFTELPPLKVYPFSVSNIILYPSDHNDTAGFASHSGVQVKSNITAHKTFIQ